MILLLALAVAVGLCAVGGITWARRETMSFRSTLDGPTGEEIARTIHPRGRNAERVVEARSHEPVANVYDPRSDVIRLAPSVFRTNSLAGQAIAAHGAHHARQNDRGYWFYRLWRSLSRGRPVIADLAWFLVVVAAANLAAMIQGPLHPMFADLGYGVSAVGEVYFVSRALVEAHATWGTLRWLDGHGINGAAKVLAPPFGVSALGMAIPILSCAFIATS
jgi:Zn-dependent membrane protease YugP